jgi:3-hydroxyisobutyrate dehydrogenase-like beta-hydroxyacid dehydrogenase
MDATIKDAQPYVKAAGEELVKYGGAAHAAMKDAEPYMNAAGEELVKYGEAGRCILTPSRFSATPPTRL